MLAYKFLRPGAVGPFSRVAWPRPEDGAPGRWVLAGGMEPGVCTSGVHACRVQDLPLWIAAELWLVELRGPLVETNAKVVGTAGRLRARLDGWDAEAATDFSAGCARRVREAAAHHPDRPLNDYAGDVEVYGLGERAKADPFRAAAVSGLISATAAEVTGGASAGRAERARQAAWLEARLGLDRVGASTPANVEEQPL
jgi:hypothetical protein